MNNMSYIFGPVPSRRLGRSLGVNIVPKKVCSLDCVYCEVGITNNLTIKRKPYIKTADIINEFNMVYSKIKDTIDIITITAAGEPTLNSNLREILHQLKKTVQNEKEIAILTNTTLITDPDVYNTLLEFDIVIPSLDAITYSNFNKINKPHKDIDISMLADRLITFSNEYAGKLYLEILFVKGINDSEDELNHLISIVKNINYDKLQLTTVYRPPAYKDIKQLTEIELNKIENYFISHGLQLEKTLKFKNNTSLSTVNIEKSIANLLNMRPVTADELIALFDINKVELDRLLNNLLNTGDIVSLLYDNKLFYYHKSLKLNR